MYRERKELYKKLEDEFNTKLLVYVTGDRLGAGAQISSDVIDFLVPHLDKIGDTEKISLFLYTAGGDVFAAWTIANLLRMFCRELQIIIPRKAQSAGTLMCLGADEIVMSKQATLGPFDPYVNSPFNPRAEGDGQPQPVSVEEVKGYIRYVEDKVELKDGKIPPEVFMKLSEYVNPVVLGRVYRMSGLIKEMSSSLLRNQLKDEDKINDIVEFLSGGSGDHGYTINRREAEKMGLNVKKPSQSQYDVMEAIYRDVRFELSLTQQYDPATANGHQALKLCLLESVAGGSDYFSVEKNVSHIPEPNSRTRVQESVLFCGWRHDALTDADNVNHVVRDGDVQYRRGDNDGEL